MQVVVQGLLTDYDKIGKGKIVVMLHGWGDDRRTFTDLINELKNSYEIVALDLPGFGNSETPEATWGLTEYAIFVRQFLKKIGVSRVAAYIGHSNGGAIALRGLGTKALHADKLILLASSGIRDVYKGRNKILRLAAKTGKVLTMPLPARAKDRLRRKAYQTIGSDLFVTEHLQETFKKVVTDDVQADAQKLALPTILIYGHKDTSTPVIFGERFKSQINGSTLTAVEAGHFVHHDKPAEVTKLITEFLKQK